MRKDPLVSVIIPVYNVEPYLEEALDSVINQTYRNLEIIIIDDGSTDGSSDICDTYARKDSRIKVIHQENRGLSGARNTGLDIMTGQVVAFLDSDDAFYHHTIEKMLRVMISKQADVVACEIDKYQTIGGMKNRSRKKNSIRIHICKDPADYYLYSPMSIVVWNKLYRGELWKDLRFAEGLMYEDYLATLVIANQARAICSVSESLIKYRVRPGSLTNSQTSNKNIKDFLAINKLAMEYLKKMDLDVSDACFRIYCQYLLNYLIRLCIRADHEEIQKLRKIVLKAGRRIDVKECSLKTRVSFYMMTNHPKLLRLLYRIYHPVHHFVWLISHK